jgi:uncharacterized membrane protein
MIKEVTAELLLLLIYEAQFTYLLCIGCVMCSNDKNIMEAAASGAVNAIPACANIAANLIAFIAILEFVNATLTWFGHRAGLVEPELTFEVFEKCTYETLFFPGLVNFTII